MTLLERARARKPITWLTVVGIVLLPVVIGGVLIAALHDPTERLENMTAAIVNDDEAVTVDGQLTPLGRQLSSGLVSGSDDADSNLTWVLSNDEDAEAGLADGSYQAVVTIPENFSAAAMSSAENLSGDDAAPEQATIDVETAPDALVVDQAIADQLAAAAAGSMGDMLSEATMSNLLVGFSTMGEQLGDAADGAEQLADGAGEAEDGAGELADGADHLADGVGQLGDGIGQLADGAGDASTGAYELSDGARALADGAPALADGAGELAAGASGVADGADELTTGADQLAGGASGLAEGAAGLADGIDQLGAGISGDGTAGNPGLEGGARQLADGTAQLEEGIAGDGGVAAGAAQLAAGLDEVKTGVIGSGTAENPALVQGANGVSEAMGGISSGLNGDGSAENPGLAAGNAQLASGLEELAASCAASGGSAEFCERLAGASFQADGLATGAADLATAASQAAPGATELAEGVSALAYGVIPLADGAQQLSDGTAQIADQLPALTAGAESLADGAEQLGAGIPQLSDGAHQLADGGASLSGGAAQLADGTGQLADGAGALSGGASQLADGTEQLGGGASALAEGTSSLADGVGQLATGAGQAAAGVPTLQDGAIQLSEGASGLGDGVGQLGDGAGELADGLGTAVDSVPSYTQAEADDLATVVANPVAASSGTGLFGASAIPLLVVAVLWFGSLATFFVLRAFPAAVMASRRSSAFLAGRSLLPAAVIGAVQGAAVAGIVQLASGYDAAEFWPLLGLSVLAGVSFAAVNQALVAVFRGAGRWIAGIVGAYSVAIGIVSTMPAALLAIRPLLPTSPAFDGMIAAITGTSGAGAATVALLIWGVVSFIATTIAVTARRTVSSKALIAPAAA
ncbi:YhgE/Pip domain-containing protein [Microbacterium halophytorum]|uniref:YhgE/Pip domain-containing protein n=1 Tax=Microbacterium halophytorum TaxID=2067568 RepID=UPI000CFBE097|nr:YhgE/Pip domain-containing protein [Microbacterium halophytorum]